MKDFIRRIGLKIISIMLPALLIGFGMCIPTYAADAEYMSIGAYAWQLFIRSDGEKVNFAYEGDNILYLENNQKKY